MAYSRTVLSVSDEDIRGYVDDATWKALVDADMVEEAVDIACGHMQNYLDQLGFFEEMCVDGASRARLDWLSAQLR